jgi:hypothetical protein
VTRRLHRTWPQDFINQWNRLQDGETSLDVSPCKLTTCNTLIFWNDVDCKEAEKERKKKGKYQSTWTSTNQELRELHESTDLVVDMTWTKPK